MALFNAKGKKEVKTAVKKDAPATPRVAATKEPKVSGMKTDLTHILKHARVTEKATMHASSGVYVFDISEFATKRDIVRAVISLYKVTPRKVAVATVPTKMRRNMRTGKYGMTKRGRKAYIYLKKGETINL